MLIWNREVLTPLNDKTLDDQTLVNRVLKTFNKFLINDINKSCGVDFKPNSKICGFNDKESSIELIDSELSLYNDYFENSSKHYSNASTICSSVDSMNGGVNILNNKNLYDEMNSFEFQAQYFIEQ